MCPVACEAIPFPTFLHTQFLRLTPFLTSLKVTYHIKIPSSCSWEYISGSLKSPASVKLPKNTTLVFIFSSPLFKSCLFNELF